MSAVPSKFHTGSKIINADTQTDIGTILHDASLKTVNGVSLVGSGDLSPLDITLIGTATNNTTFTHNASQYKFILFEYESTANDSRQTMLERYRVVSSKTHTFTDALEQGQVTLGFSIAANSISVSYPSQSQINISVFGVK